MARRDESGGKDSTTLSTRFGEEELEVLKRAADAKGWSLSKLLRIGAYEKSVNVLNASLGDGRHYVRQILEEVVRQLFLARFVGIPCQAPSYEDGVFELSSEERKEVCIPSWKDNPGADVIVSELSVKTFRELLLAIRSFGSELAPFLEEEWQRSARTGSKEFSDLVILPDMAKLASDPGEPDTACEEEQEVAPTGKKKRKRAATQGKRQ